MDRALECFMLLRMMFSIVDTQLSECQTRNPTRSNAVKVKYYINIANIAFLNRFHWIIIRATLAKTDRTV